ncbi:STAS domain-containing protein [Actinoplanes sp. NPDC024001]|uniref:STAS domain-containing protein n=1 Tax=Actinoplanes sp. NPDC024001 TaxID=3154598 RepID=UPI0033E7F3E4
MELPAEPAKWSPELSVTPAGDRAAVRLTVSGDLDMVGVQEFLDRTGKLLPSLTGPLELDLRAVGFIDGAGVRALLQLQHEASRSGHRITVVAVSPAVALILTLLGCEDLGHR